MYTERGGVCLGFHVYREGWCLVRGFKYTERGDVWSGISCIQRRVMFGQGFMYTGVVFGQGFMYTERGDVWSGFHIYREGWCLVRVSCMQREVVFGQGLMYTERSGFWSRFDVYREGWCLVRVSCTQTWEGLCLVRVSCIQREVVFGQGFMCTERGGVWPWFHVYRQSEEKERVNNTTEMTGSYRSNGLSSDWHYITSATVHSVVCLCWQALADLSMGKKKVMVPYRDSVLTKLLQNALGGNRWVMDSQFGCWLHGGECKTALTVLNELARSQQVTRLKVRLGCARVARACWDFVILTEPAYTPVPCFQSVTLLTST